MNQKTKITVSGILADLENGMTRTTTGKNYNADIGCIQAKYDLTSYDLDMLFKHPKLKGKKTKTVRTTSFVLEDDTENLVNILANDTVDETANVIVTENTTNLEEHPVEETVTTNETSLDNGWD